MLSVIITFDLFYLVENEQVYRLSIRSMESGRYDGREYGSRSRIFGHFWRRLDDDFPDCITNSGNWIMPFLILAIATFFIYIVKVWGFPIVAVAIVISIYCPFFGRVVFRLDR